MAEGEAGKAQYAILAVNRRRAVGVREGGMAMLILAEFLHSPPPHY